MGFQNTGISGMGSTWYVFVYISSEIMISLFIFRYGSAHDGYLVANATLHGMLWLAQYEFATPERESKLGTMMWPEW
jgi:hypothetical protein